MKIFFIIALTVGCALGRRPPSVWHDSQCPPYNELEKFVFEGEDAPDGKFPYMLSLAMDWDMPNIDLHVCGASILTKNWALTAGHCCDGEGSYNLYAGSNRLTKGGKNYKVDYWKVHEKYNPKKKHINDICLIRVKEPFVFSDRVQQITLPTQNMTIKDGQLVNITGWGLTDLISFQTPDKLQLGKNYVAMSKESCYKKTNLTDDSFLCVLAAAKGQGVCNGDSGSPLVIGGVQVGIASWIFTPCGCEMPDIYARVPLYIDWIKKNLGKEASELKFVK